MIRRLITAWRHADEIAELRDRAVRDAAKAERTAEINGSLLADNARLIGQLDQQDTTLRNIATVLVAQGHAGTNPACLGCVILASAVTTRRNTANQPAKDHRQP